MRAAVIATAFAGIASAGHAHRRAHEALRAERRGGDYGLYPTAAAAADEECVCKTVYGTMYGEPMIYIPDQTTVETSSTAIPTYSEASSSTTTTTTTSSSVSVPPAPPAPVAPTTSSTSLYTPAAPVAPHTSSAVPSAPAPAPEAPKVTEAKVSSNVPVAPAAVPSSNPPAAKVTKTAVASVVPSQPAAPKSSSPSSSVPGALFPGQQTDHWAITYTPYTDDTGSCKTKEAVDADIKDIKSMGFTTIRVYSTDCDTLPNVGAACEKYGIRMIIGVFIKEAGCAYTGEVQEQVEGIIAWGKFNIVDMLVIGNEAVFSGLCSAAQLTTLITTVKGTCSGAGYTGPYSTAETVNVWEANGSLLCDVIDVAGAQTHPYFNAETTPSKAGSFVKGQIDIVKGICGKPAISLECGWPTKGTCNGAACPGVSEQTQAMASVRETCGEEVVFFTYGEAHWKNPGSCNCEPWFNIKGIFA